MKRHCISQFLLQEQINPEKVYFSRWEGWERGPPLRGPSGDTLQDHGCCRRQLRIKHQPFCASCQKCHFSSGVISQNRLCAPTSVPEGWAIWKRLNICLCLKGCQQGMEGRSGDACVGLSMVLPHADDNQKVPGSITTCRARTPRPLLAVACWGDFKVTLDPLGFISGSLCGRPVGSICRNAEGWLDPTCPSDPSPLRHSHQHAHCAECPEPPATTLLLSLGSWPVSLTVKD